MTRNMPDPIFLSACANTVKHSPLFILLVPYSWDNEDGITFYDPVGKFRMAVKGITNGDGVVNNEIVCAFLRHVADQIEAGWRVDDET